MFCDAFDIKTCLFFLLVVFQQIWSLTICCGLLTLGKKNVFFPSVIFEICLNYSLNYWNKWTCLIQKLAEKCNIARQLVEMGFLQIHREKLQCELFSACRNMTGPIGILGCGLLVTKTGSYCYLVNGGSRGLDAAELAVFRRATNNTKCFSLLPTGSGKSLALQNDLDWAISNVTDRRFVQSPSMFLLKGTWKEYLGYAKFISRLGKSQINKYKTIF